MLSRLAEKASGTIRPVSYRRVATGDPLFTIILDEETAIVRAETFGLRTVGEVDTFVAHLRRFVLASRQRYGRAKVLVDRHAAPVQCIAVMDRFGRASAALHRPGDKLALVVETALAEGQIWRCLVHAGAKAFPTCDDAEAWLNAWP